MNTPTKKNTYFKNYDLYSDKNPNDTIRIKYDTMKNLNITIRKLERLYKRNLYKHVRISQVANVMKQRIRVINDKERLKRATDYFDFLKERTKKNEKERKKMVFK
tara:strand:- start:470 stop:784 length:315 start_codon:yes stop_codon:yes gene_type:complete